MRCSKCDSAIFVVTEVVGPMATAKCDACGKEATWISTPAGAPPFADWKPYEVGEILRME